jgi:hypothetical protein
MTWYISESKEMQNENLFEHEDGNLPGHKKEGDYVF